MERLRVDGTDPRPRRGAPQLFSGLPTPPPQIVSGAAWLVPLEVLPISTNNASIVFVAMLGFPPNDLDEVLLEQIFPLASPHNPFGLLMTLQRKTYAGLETLLGGDPFGDTDRDDYTLGASADRLTGQRSFGVDVTSMDMSNQELKQSGAQTLILAATLQVQIPST